MEALDEVLDAIHAASGALAEQVRRGELKPGNYVLDKGQGAS